MKKEVGTWIFLVVFSTTSLFFGSIVIAADKVVVIPLNSSYSGGKFVDGTNPDDAVYTKGNVGIGTTSPETKLDVDGRARVSSFEVENSQAIVRLRRTNINNISTVNFDDSLVGGGSAYFGRWNRDSESLRVYGGGSTRLLINLTSGNVGIGTTEPLSKLSVSGLPTSPPDDSGNAGVVCVTNDGNFWLDNDGEIDCQ